MWWVSFRVSKRQTLNCKLPQLHSQGPRPTTHDNPLSTSLKKKKKYMLAYRHIPTMTDSHHGGFLSVMIMVGICQVTNSHHKWWWRNLFGTIPTKMLITTWSYIYTYYQPPAFHASQTLSEKCQKLARPLKLLYSFNTGHHHHHARAE